MRNLRKLLLVSSTLLCQDAFAVAISADINSLPIFWGMTNNNPTYQTACFKAQEAFLIQTGVTPMYNRLNSYVSDKAMHAVNTFVDKNMPFSSKTAATVIGTAYAIGIKRQVAGSFRNPLWTRMTTDVSVSQDTISVSFHIPF